MRASITDLKARIDRYRHRINVLDSEIRPLEKLLDEQTKAAFKKNGTDHDDNTVQTYYKLSRKRIDREQLDKTLDRLIDELDKLESLPDCKVEAPPEVKLYHVGTRYKPEPEVRQDIGSTIKPFHPFFALAVGGDRSKTNFDVEPPFGVNGSGFVFAISGGGLFDIPGTPTSVGARVGWLGGNTTGSIENPSTGFLYDVKRSSAFYQEALLQFSINPGNSTRPPTMFPFVTASAGIAEFKLQFHGTSGAFQVTDSPTITGFTGTIGFGIPIYQTLSDGTLAVFTEARIIKTDSFDIKLPSRFQSKYQSTNVTAGFRYRW